jgi:hypothetical protein
MAVVHTSSPVVEEHHVIHDTDSSSSNAMVIAVLLIVLLVAGFFLIVSGALPFSAANRSSTIDVDLPAVTTPDTTPDVNVNNENNPSPPVSY